MNIDELKRIAKPAIEEGCVMHMGIRSNWYHLILERETPVWDLWRNDFAFVENSDRLDSIDRELLGKYVNALITVPEALTIADFLKEKEGVEIDVQPVKFPLSQPFFTSYLYFPEGQDRPDEIYVGNMEVPPHEILHSFLYDTCRNSAEWSERVDFSDDFGLLERYGGNIKSFCIPAGEILHDVAIHFYSEDHANSCFMFKLAGVHSHIARYRAFDSKEVRHHV